MTERLHAGWLFAVEVDGGLARHIAVRIAAFGDAERAVLQKVGEGKTEAYSPLTDAFFGSEESGSCLELIPVALAMPHLLVADGVVIRRNSRADTPQARGEYRLS